jgi:hypothetical protein
MLTIVSGDIKVYFIENLSNVKNEGIAVVGQTP